VDGLVGFGLFYVRCLTLIEESRQAVGGVPIVVSRWDVDATERPLVNPTLPMRVVQKPLD
jgi:hypothetical protein